MAKRNILFEWIKKIFSEFLMEIKTDYPYKLIDYNFCEKGNKFLITVQLQHKNIKREIEPKTLLSDNNLVRMMSPENIRLITYLACKNSFSVTYKIVAQNFTDAGIKDTIEIRHVETNKSETKLIGEILSNKDFLNRMHPEDIFRLGFAAGAASVANERINFNNE